MMQGLRTKDSKDLVVFIRGAGVASLEAIRAKFADRAASSGCSVARWLTPKMQRLEDGGYIERCVGGFRVPDAVLEVEHLVEEAAAPVGSVATPRRISMLGTEYVPRPAAHRPGADDHARCPSLINGRPHRYRSAW